MRGVACKHACVCARVCAYVGTEGTGCWSASKSCHLVKTGVGRVIIMVPEAGWTKPEWGKFGQVERQGPFLFFLQIHAVNMTALFWACAMGHVERWYVAGDVCAPEHLRHHPGSRWLLSWWAPEWSPSCPALLPPSGESAHSGPRRGGRHSEERDSYLTLDSFQIWLLM